jgi:mercuric ion transport protein
MGLTVGGLGAAFGAAACCALPILLGSLGVGTAWLFGIARIAAPHRLALLGVAGALLAGGAWALWRQTRTVCAPGGWCARAAVRWFTSAGIVLGLALAVLGYRYG